MSQEVIALERAYKLLEQGWTQFRSAANIMNIGVAVNSESATCWCLGAVFERVVPTDEELRLSLQNLIANTICSLGFGKRDAAGPMKCIVFFNDEPARTHTEVLSVVKAALITAKEQEFGN